MGLREYKSGTRWCIWRWSLVPSDFIRRLHLIKTPWFAVVLHWIRKPDEEPWLHDHPVTFLSLILRGWYQERREKFETVDGGMGFVGGGYEDYSGKRKWWNFIRASKYDRHTITDCDPKTLTLCFMGPVRRQWGYHTDSGWKFWKDYNKEKYG